MQIFDDHLIDVMLRDGARDGVAVSLQRRVSNHLRRMQVPERQRQHLIKNFRRKLLWKAGPRFSPAEFARACKLPTETGS